MGSRLIPKPQKQVKFINLPKSAGILDDYAVRKNIASKEGTIEKTPTNSNHIVNKAYVDVQASGIDPNHTHSKLVASDGTPDPALSVDAAGNVGIGITSPTTKLELADPTTNAIFTLRSLSTDIFGTGDNGRFIGNIQFAGNDKLVGEDGVGAKIVALSDGTWSTLTNDFPTQLRFYTNQDGEPTPTTTRMTIRGNGKVGIGTTSPTARLQVGGTAVPLVWTISANNTATTVIGDSNRDNSLLINTPSFSSGVQSGIAFDGSYSTPESTLNIKALGVKSTSTVYGSNLAFYTTYQNTLNERMRIDKNGNVGIGTSSPSKKLDVNGDISLEAGSGDYYSNDGSQGWSGSFTNGDGDTVTVKNGIITDVS